MSLVVRLGIRSTPRRITNKLDLRVTKEVNLNRPVIISAIPTAFHADGSLDLPGCAAIIRHALEGGADAVFVNGTTGEFPSLDREERASIIKTAISNAGAERVIAHIGASSAWEAKRYAVDALEQGVTSFAAITPFYFPASATAVHEYFAEIAQATSGTKLYAYLFPDRTSVHLTPAEAAKIITEIGLSGAKVSIPGVDYISQLIGILPDDLDVYSGNDGLISSVHKAGGAGVVSGVSSTFPHPFVDMAKAIGAGDSGEVQRLQPVVDDAVATVGPSIASLKHALALQGVIEHDGCRMALDPPNDELRKRIANLVGALGVHRDQ